MRNEAVVRSYSDALFGLGVKQGLEEEYGEALLLVDTLLRETPEFGAFLQTPRIPVEEKKKVLRHALADEVPEAVLHFLFLAVEKRRQRLLREMARAYRDLLDEHQDRVRVEVQVAHPLDREALEVVKDRLSRYLGKEAVPEVEVNPELIGGILFRRGDTVFDGSLRRRLRGMRKELMAADISHEQDE